MGHLEHKEKAPASVAVAVVTVSTSRTPVDDRSGDLMARLLNDAGHKVVARRLVRDDTGEIQTCVQELASLPEVRAVLLSGGTGITRTDLTLEAVSPYVQTWLPGFGELFRSVSFAEIGPAAMLSRAAAAVCRVAPEGRRFFLAVLPGSPAAVRLALEKLLLPELGHVLYEIDR